MREEIIELTGKEPGSTSMILVGVHGNEKCGIEALSKVLPSLEIQKGQVLIGYGNPKAIEQNVRFTDSNLNRMFRPDETLSEKERRGYEYTRAQFLKEYLDRADALLDVHASLTAASQRFIICEQNAKDTARHLPFPLVVSGFNQVEPGGTDYYMNQKGKVGICVECGYFDNPSSVKTAEEGIKAFLVARGNAAGDLEIYPQSSLQIDSLYLTKSDSFVLTRQFEDFEKVAAGQTIGIDGADEVKTRMSGVILFARNRNRVGEEAFLFGQYKR